MNRSAKRHRSTKVPNVKLRPAPVGVSASHTRRRQEAEAESEDLAHYRQLRRKKERSGKRRANESGEEDDENDDDYDKDDDRGPLLGCVICITGVVEERVKLTEYVQLLGGNTQGNLTEDATHLIASEPGSKKYCCALKLGLPIMNPEWIKELRARYTEAIDYDFDGLLQEFRLDTFENVVAALAGITEATERTEIRKKLKSGSASTPTTFTLDGSFTHLVCGDIKNSQTMEAVVKYRRKAQRFLRRGETLPDDQEPLAREMKAAIQLRVVWKEWVDDCLEVQGSIVDDIYSVEEPRPTTAQRRELINSILEEREKKAQLNKEVMMAARQQSTEPVIEIKGAPTQVKETPSTGNNKVQRVVKKPKIDINQYVQQISRGEMEPPASRCQTKTSDKESRSFSGLKKARSFTEHSEQSTILKPPTPLDKHNSITAEEEVWTEETPVDEDEEEIQLEEDPAAGLRCDIREKSLSSLSFRLDLRDVDRNQAVRKALEKEGVQDILEAKDSGKAHFYILPLGKVDVPVTTTTTTTSSPSKSSHLGVAVTHLFIERCLFESRVLNLNESFALQPAVVCFPLKGAEDVHVALTGFAAEDDVDRKQVEIALKAAGIETTSTLKKGHHTHLLIGKEATDSKSSKTKIQRAKEWGIHCVGLEFVENLYRRGTIEPAISKIGAIRDLQSVGRAMSRGTSMGASIQEIGSQASFQPQQANPRALSVIQQATHSTRPWQRSASGSQALLDGEESRGLFSRNSLALYGVDSLEAGSLAIKTSAEEVMALLSNRQLGDTSYDSDLSTTSNVRKRSRLPPSRLRERRATSVAGLDQDQTGDENPSAEELLAIRKEEELLVGNNGYTQSVLNQQENESMRVIYDDPTSRRERRKLGDLIATSVKNKAQQDEAASTRSSSTEVDDEVTMNRKMSRPNSVSPSKQPYSNTNFSPSIKARRQPGTCNRD